MAHALERGRSILMLRSHRGSGRKAESNIVWEYPHATIPRHLRDIVVTETARICACHDEVVIQKLICIADSRWQEELRLKAVGASKLNPAWRIPPTFRNNHPQWVKQSLQRWRAAGRIDDYPFGSDFTAAEQQLARALAYLASRGNSPVARMKYCGCDGTKGQFFSTSRGLQWAWKNRLPADWLTVDWYLALKCTARVPPSTVA
jgi:hypothetical protein